MFANLRRLTLAATLTVLANGCETTSIPPDEGAPATAASAAVAEPASGLRDLIHLTRCTDRLAGVDEGIASCSWLLANAVLTPKSRAKVLVARATLHAAAGDLSTGISDLNSAEAINPTSEGLHLLRAQILFDLSDYEAALPDVRTADRLAPGETRPHVLEAQLMALLGRDAEALAAVDRALALNGSLGDGHVLRAAIVLGQGDYFVAVDGFDRAEELGVHPGRMAPLRAVALLRLKEYRRAIDDLDLALADEPDNQNHWMLRGQAHAELGLATEAGRNFERALDLAPESARILNGVAWAYATSPAPVRDPAAAKLHADKAIRLEPQNGYYLDTYAAAFVAAGDHATAMLHYRRAMEIQPEVPGIYQDYLRERGLYRGDNDGLPSEELIRAMERHIRSGCALTDETCEGPGGVRVAG